MAGEIKSYHIHLEGDAKKALLQIAELLRKLGGGRDVTLEEALQLALGTELYLLTKVNKGATVAVESKEDGFVELNLASSDLNCYQQFHI